MARTLSAEDYQELGKTYYKRKQYQQAIEAFTQGIDTAVIPSVALYDYRAASYEKLANFNAAVKDGREAIRLNKKDVKGYLRTGSVLQKMNKLDTALNIYKYGMKNVSVEHKDFPVCPLSWTIVPPLTTASSSCSSCTTDSRGSCRQRKLSTHLPCYRLNWLK